jgi:hypothetical protein
MIWVSPGYHQNANSWRPQSDRVIRKSMINNDFLGSCRDMAGRVGQSPRILIPSFPGSNPGAPATSLFATVRGRPLPVTDV